MAVIKLSPFATAMSGVMKNLTFSQDGANTIMKEREAPANPRSAAQMANRTNFSLSSKGYGKLSAEDAAKWKTWADEQIFVGKKGKAPYTPNPFEAYKHLTQVWYASHGGQGTAPTAPPTTAYEPPRAQIEVAAATGAIHVNATAALGAGTVVEFKWQFLKNANRKPSSGGYRIKGYLFFQNGSEQDSFAVAPGAVACGYRFVNMATGEATPFVTVPVVSVALSIETGGAAETSEKPASRRKAA